MADSVRPLLTSMKLFGLYFRSRRETGDNVSVTDEKSRGRWNQYVIYAVIVAVLLWINVVRMSSVFKIILCDRYLLVFGASFAETSLILSCLMQAYFIYFSPTSSKDEYFNGMFSVFTAHETFGPFLFFKFIVCLN